MTPTFKVPALDEYWRWFEPHLRPFSPEEQRAAVALYRELAKGKPVDANQLGRALGISSADAQALLQSDAVKRFVYPDDKGRVLGFGATRGGADASSLRGGWSDLVDLVRLGQPVHPGNPGAFGARHVARSRNRGNRAPRS